MSAFRVGQDHARPGIDHVRILVRLDEGGDLHLPFSDLVGDAADPRERRHDLDLGERGRGGEKNRYQNDGCIAHR